MKCPACGNLESKVVDSRPSDDGSSIRRRRECLQCGRRFTTYERLGDNPLIIIKSDGSSEAYDRQKLMRGLLIACAKRPIAPEQLGALIDMALVRLAKLDDVAYVRFASVYKDFQNVEEFAAALEGLK